MTIDADKTFENHVATYEKISDHLETLKWREPGTSIYGIYYVRQFNTLMVYGDCYEAVYQWGQQVSLGWIAGCNLGYFIGKCRASPHGRSPYYWQACQLKKDLEAQFKEEEEERAEMLKEILRDCRETAHETSMTEAEAKEELEALEGKSTRQKFEEEHGWSCVEEEHEWIHFVREHGEEVFGTDCWEWVGDHGKFLDPCIELHFAGLKLAVAQMRANQVAPQNDQPAPAEA